MIQLITKMGRVPWDDLEVPAGRTIKACQVMLDKEKSKIKKARESDAKSDDSANKEAGAGKKERAKAKKSSKVTAQELFHMRLILIAFSNARPTRKMRTLARSRKLRKARLR